ncbi:MAG: carboxypeptidase-like regulatory domain-containing protein [Clostridia bacterium]|nr:carboxypeptidase-like regulatory domain-containing protein [Clostridia bacterium]
MELDKEKYPVIGVDGVISSGKQFDIDITLPEDNRSVIYGIIKDAYDEPVKDAVVKLIEVEKDCGKEERKPVSHTFTDKDGEFVFGPLCANKFYEIQVWANDVKHKKICTASHHKGKCLKGVKLDCDKDDRCLENENNCSKDC